MGHKEFLWAIRFRAIASPRGSKNSGFILHAEKHSIKWGCKNIKTPKLILHIVPSTHFQLQFQHQRFQIIKLRISKAMQVDIRYKWNKARHNSSGNNNTCIVSARISEKRLRQQKTYTAEVATYKLAISQEWGMIEGHVKNGLVL